MYCTYHVHSSIKFRSVHKFRMRNDFFSLVFTEKVMPIYDGCWARKTNFLPTMSSSWSFAIMKNATTNVVIGRILILTIGMYSLLEDRIKTYSFSQWSQEWMAVFYSFLKKLCSEKSRGKSTDYRTYSDSPLRFGIDSRCRWRPCTWILRISHHCN